MSFRIFNQLVGGNVLPSEQGFYVCSASSGGDVLVQIRLGNGQTTQSSDILFGVLLERHVHGMGTPDWLEYGVIVDRH